MMSEAKIADLLEKAVVRHRRGEFVSAAGLYRRVLRARPDHADALHLLGLTELEQGREQRAETLIRKAVSQRPDDPVYRHALANVLNRQGRLEDARQELETALRQDPTLARGWGALGEVCGRLGRHDEAVAAYARAAELEPMQPAVFIGLAVACAAAGQVDAAVRAARRAHELAPSDTRIQRQVAELAARLDRWALAAACYEALVRLEPDNFQNLNDLSRAHFENHDFERAAAACRRLIEREGPSAGRLLDLARIALRGHRLEDAIANVEQAIALAPDMAEAHVTLARYHIFAGDYGAAREALRAALDRDPAYAGAYLQLAEIDGLEPDGPDLDALCALAETPRLSPLARSQAGFALARLLEARGEHDAAFARLAQANSDQAEAYGQGGFSYDPGNQERFIDDVIARFNGDRFKAIEARGSDSAVPVFILGMPRSGTTLVEQILSSHPDFFGAGERGDLRRLYAQFEVLCQHDPEAAMAPAIAARAREWADNYFASLPEDAREAARVSDKMPINFLYLGLAAFLFPNARIIHVRRDPLDTCLSIYWRAFPPAYTFAHDLANLGHFYTQYDRLMRHWRRHLPLAMLEVRYEDLIASPEETSRRLVDFCGLEWDAACLNFHENRRPAFTFSELQVRKPIYTSSVGRWQRFRDQLAPLIEALAPELRPADPS